MSTSVQYISFGLFGCASLPAACLLWCCLSLILLQNHTLLCKVNFSPLMIFLTGGSRGLNFILTLVIESSLQIRCVKWESCIRQTLFYPLLLLATTSAAYYWWCYSSYYCYYCDCQPLLLLPLLATGCCALLLSPRPLPHYIIITAATAAAYYHYYKCYYFHGCIATININFKNICCIATIATASAECCYTRLLPLPLVHWYSTATAGVTLLLLPQQLLLLRCVVNFIKLISIFVN